MNGETIGALLPIILPLAGWLAWVAYHVARDIRADRRLDRKVAERERREKIRRLKDCTCDLCRWGLGPVVELEQAEQRIARENAEASGRGAFR